MSLTKNGFTGDPEKIVKSILKAVRSAKDSKTQISIGAQPVNEFTDFAKLLSGGFPVEFPLGVTDTDLGGPGPIQQRVLLRLLKIFDGRVVNKYAHAARHL